MLKQQWWIVAAMVAVLVACGGSKKPAACVTGTAGAKACSAVDGGTAGMSGSGGTGGSSTSSGSSGSGSGSSGKGGSGGTGGSGSGGSSTASDAGGSGSGGSSSTFPMDGNQLSVCTHLQGDCNKGLGCTGYTPPGQGFCSKTCTMDADCMSLSGAKYTCPAGGLCVISCMNAMDTTSCPSGMTCQAVPTFGGMGMGTPTFRCKYPSPPDAGMMMMAGTTPEWAKCTAMSTGASACAMGLTCVGANLSMSRTGFCSKTCTMDTECSTKPGSGTIAPSCVPNGTRGAQTCALPCMPMGTGCPDMMTCVAGTMGAPSYCEYM